MSAFSAATCQDGSGVWEVWRHPQQKQLLREAEQIIVGNDPGIAKLGACVVALMPEGYVPSIQWTNPPRGAKDVLRRHLISMGRRAVVVWMGATDATCKGRLSVADDVWECMDQLKWAYPWDRMLAGNGDGTGLAIDRRGRFIMEKQNNRRMQTMRQDMDWVIGALGGAAMEYYDGKQIAVVSSTRKTATAIQFMMGAPPTQPPRGYGDRNRRARKEFGVGLVMKWLERTEQLGCMSALASVTRAEDRWDVCDALLTALVGLECRGAWTPRDFPEIPSGLLGSRLPEKEKEKECPKKKATKRPRRQSPETP